MKIATGDIYEIEKDFKIGRHLLRKGQLIHITRKGSCWVKFKCPSKPTYEFIVNYAEFKKIRSNYLRSKKRYIEKSTYPYI